MSKKNACKELVFKQMHMQNNIHLDGKYYANCLAYSDGVWKPQ